MCPGDQIKKVRSWLPCLSKLAAILRFSVSDARLWTSFVVQLLNAFRWYKNYLLGRHVRRIWSTRENLLQGKCVSQHVALSLKLFLLSAPSYGARFLRCEQRISCFMMLVFHLLQVTFMQCNDNEHFLSLLMMFILNLSNGFWLSES